MKKIIEEYIAKTFGESYASELKFILGENFNLFNMLDTKTIKHPDSEIRFRKKHLINKVKSSFGSDVEPVPIHQLRTGSSESRFLFINGVVTPYALALHQVTMLAKYLNQEVELIHNETDGLVKDLVECNEGRYGVINTIAQQSIDVIKDKLTYEGDLTIIAHSQGAIIITSALLELAKTLSPIELSRIKFVTFGAAFKESVLPNIECEHFANSNDPITHLGLQNLEHKFTGKLFVREAKGHFFIADYIIPMSQGKSCGKSNFEKLINKACPMDSYKETMKNISVFDLQELYDNEKSKEQSFSQWPFNTSVLDCNEKLKADITLFSNTIKFPFYSKNFTTKQLIETISQEWFAIHWSPKFIDVDCANRGKELIQKFKKSMINLPKNNIFETYLIFAYSEVLRLQSEKESIKLK
jgi:hypothetical protein